MLLRAVHRGQGLKEGQHSWIRVPAAADKHPDLHPPIECSCPYSVIDERPVSVESKVIQSEKK